jgi:putative spermidine/putrescine transport system ATP-binding protein
VDTGKVSDGTSAAAAKISGRRGESEVGHPNVSVQASPAPSLLSLTAIAKSYGSVIALAGIDLRVPDGEIVTILGPSGSGKTTLLKIVAGFELPDAGRVELAGDDITYVTPASRGIGMVFQNYALFPHMRVAENIAFPLEMRRLARAETQERVSRALALVGLAGYEARYPRQLSGGQQQRVALARAIVFEPRLLLLDEPFGALDRKLREQMQLEVKRLQRQLGITALFVTHDQEEALVLSDRIAVMDGGLIEQIGAPAEVYSRPANRFVADFIGESNIYRGKVTSASGQVLRVALSTGQTLVVRGAVPRPVGAEVGLVLRPEAPSELLDGDTAENATSGVIRDVVYVGDAIKYAIQLDGGGEMVVRWPFRQNLCPHNVGETLRIGWPGDLLHVVDWS